MSTSEEIKAIMENAKKAIEQKKAQLGITTTADLKKDDLAAKKAKIAATLASAHLQNILANNTNNQAPVAATPAVPGPVGTRPNQAPPEQLTPQERDRLQNLIIDSEGRTVDKRTGEIVHIQSRMPTLKANLKVAQQQQQRRSDKGPTDLFASGFASTISNASGILTSASSNLQASIATTTASKPSTSASSVAEESEKFFDPRLKMKAAERNKRKLVFNERGKFEDIANKLRTKAKLTLLQQEIASISRRTGISSESKLALIQPKKIGKETVPNIEWWDFALLNEMNYESVEKLSEDELKEKLKINKLIEHPVQMKPPTHTEKKVVPSVMLTAKERKKLRRQNRAETMKEQQEKIRLGLIPPPEPKVKISNLMRVLGTEAVQDPTKVEEYVRNQMAKRQKAHEDQNASRKLTDAERAAKKTRKLTENTQTGVQVAIYRVRDINDPAIKFKVEANCNQLHMTGIVLLYKTTNVIIVEGGPKQHRKFKRLMLNRIKWNESVLKKSAAVEAESEDGKKEKNTCKLVWEGTIKNRMFGTIIFKSCPTATFASEYLKKSGCEQYWDIAQSDAILQSSDF